MADDKNNNDLIIPSLAQQHYFLFNKDFDSSSCGDAMTFILERNFLQDDKKPDAIRFIINSRGGEATSCFALIDVIEASSIPIYTYGLGEISSAGLLLFMTGEKGHRYITRNTSILSHQFSGCYYGKEHELIACQKDLDQTKERILNHYKKYTGLPEKKIKECLLLPSDLFLTPKEAIKYNIADKIIGHL